MWQNGHMNMGKQLVHVEKESNLYLTAPWSMAQKYVDTVLWPISWNDLKVEYLGEVEVEFEMA
jgi:hypothetical protein